MDDKTELERRVAEWEKGFTACALLMTGRYEDYAKERDKWLAMRSGKHTQISDAAPPSQQPIADQKSET